jgi:hypothetical protein
MLILNNTSSLIRVVTGGAANVTCELSAIKKNGTTYTADPKITAAITTATNTTVTNTLSSGDEVNIKGMAFKNSHASVSTTVQVQKYDGSNYADLCSTVTLLPGESLIYGENGQWQHLDGSGGVYNFSAGLNNCVRVTADSVHATAATWADVTGLQQVVKSGVRYAFEAHLYHISNATTTGAQFGIGGVAMTAMLIGAQSVVTNSATAATMSSGTATAVDTAAVVQTTGAAAVAPTVLSGSFQPSADGTFSIRATSEVTVASGLTVKAGSWLKIWQISN